jgi:hypothetical protein
LPFRLKRYSNDKFGYVGVKNDFNVSDPCGNISSGENLLDCVAKRHYVIPEKIRKLVKDIKGKLVIEDGLLMVEISPDQVAELNNKLLGLGISERKAAILGVPEKISPQPDSYSRERLWNQLYGNRDIPELY